MLKTIIPNANIKIFNGNHNSTEYENNDELHS